MSNKREFKVGDKVRVDLYTQDWTAGRIDGEIISVREFDDSPVLVKFEGYGGQAGHGFGNNEWYVETDHIAIVEEAKKQRDLQYMLTDGDDLLEEFMSEAEALKAANEYGTGKYVLWVSAAEITVESVSEVEYF